MSTGMLRRVDREEQTLAQVPLGGNRILGSLGGMLFGLVARLAAPGVVSAAIPNAPTPYGCGGYAGCDCCSGVVCCDNGCQNSSGGCSSPDGQCWYSCVGGTYYECCDYYAPNSYYGQPYPHNCICSVFAGRC